MQKKFWLTMGVLFCFALPTYSDDGTGDTDKITGPTHKQVRSLLPEHDGKPIPLNTFCLDHEGNILAAVGGPGRQGTISEDGESAVKEPPLNFVQFYSPDWKVLKEVSLDFRPTAINVDTDGYIYVGGDSAVCKLSPGGEIVKRSFAPNLAGQSEEVLKAAAAKKLDEQRQQLTGIYTQQVKQLEQEVATRKKHSKKNQEGKDLLSPENKTGDKTDNDSKEATDQSDDDGDDDDGDDDDGDDDDGDDDDGDDDDGDDDDGDDDDGDDDDGDDDDGDDDDGDDDDGDDDDGDDDDGDDDDGDDDDGDDDDGDDDDGDDDDGDDDDGDDDDGDDDDGDADDGDADDGDDDDGDDDDGDVQPGPFAQLPDEQLTQMLDSMKESLKQANTQYAATDERIAQIIEGMGQINSIAVGGEDVYVTCQASTGFGYEIWRVNRDLADPKMVKGKLGGCCGQLDIQAAGDHLLIAENTKFRVGIYDRDGNSLESFGKQDRTGDEGFGSCCNPMNIRCCSNGDILTAESSIGTIKRYDAKGNLLGNIGRAKIGGGCKHVALAHDEKLDRYYMMYQDEGSICVLVPNAQVNGETDDERAAHEAADGLGKQLVGNWKLEKSEKNEPGSLSGYYQFSAAKFSQEGELQVTSKNNIFGKNTRWQAIRQKDSRLFVSLIQDQVELFQMAVDFDQDNKIKIGLVYGNGNPNWLGSFERSAE